MGLITRSVVGLVLGGGLVALTVLTFGTQILTVALALGAVTFGISLLGSRVPRANGAVIGVVVGGFLGTVWLMSSVQSGITVPAPLLPLFLVLPAGVYGGTGFVAGERWSPGTLFAVGVAVAAVAFLLPGGWTQFLTVSALVLVPLAGVGVRLGMAQYGGGGTEVTGVER